MSNATIDGSRKRGYHTSDHEREPSKHRFKRFKVNDDVGSLEKPRALMDMFRPTDTASPKVRFDTLSQDRSCGERALLLCALLKKPNMSDGTTALRPSSIKKTLSCNDVDKKPVALKELGFSDYIEGTSGVFGESKEIQTKRTNRIERMKNWGGVRKIDEELAQMQAVLREEARERMQRKPQERKIGLGAQQWKKAKAIPRAGRAESSPEHSGGPLIGSFGSDPYSQLRPPKWLVECLDKLKVRYPDDCFQALMKRVAIDPRNGGTVSIEQGQPGWKSSIVPRIKCEDCVGKLYATGPGMTVQNFQVHITNRKHRELVNARLHRQLFESAAILSKDTDTQAIN